ncbi:MAG: helix-turn-helix domain-containing protein [Oscillospiraceae bacterium]|nr:helix-turn-helix domain-containing protein [Oscillospiraceae bacterium]
MLDKENFVPLWEKYALTINEAKSYFNIGDKTLRRLIDDNVYADFVLQNGNKYLIKREKFESFLNNSYSI